jgi:hypothetical protein
MIRPGRAFHAQLSARRGTLEVLGHIRRAREAGESWAAVDALLGFGPIAAEGQARAALSW